MRECAEITGYVHRKAKGEHQDNFEVNEQMSAYHSSGVLAKISK